MIGAIFGDIAGSVYEFDNIRTKDFPMFSEGCGFTDDTVMTVAVAEALLGFDHAVERIEEFKAALVRTMHKYGDKYPYAGYGGRFALWLSSHGTEPYNSYGNGSAMRVSPVAWYASTLDEAMSLARATAEITHNHPEGVKGAVVAAGAAFLARKGADKETILDLARQFYDMDFTLDGIRQSYSFNETCMDTVPQAIRAFYESESFEDAIRCGISIGGDSDTLCAITGAVAEAYYGLSESERERALSYLDSELKAVAVRFTEKYVK